MRGFVQVALGVALLSTQTGWSQQDPVARLEAEVAANPSQLDLAMELGDAAAKAGRLDLALASFQKVLAQLEPDSRGAGDLHLRIGETYRRKGDLAAATQSLKRASQLLPDRAVVMGTLALVLDASGFKAEAVDAYGATLALDPDNAIAMNNLAFLLAEQGKNLDQAWGLAQHAIELTDDDPEVLDTAGWVQWKRREVDSAIELFSKALSKDAENAEYRKHLLMAIAERQDAAAGELRALLAGSGKDAQKLGDLLRAIQRQ